LLGNVGLSARKLRLNTHMRTILTIISFLFCYSIWAQSTWSSDQTNTNIIHKSNQENKEYAKSHSLALCTVIELKKGKEKKQSPYRITKYDSLGNIQYNTSYRYKNKKKFNKDTFIYDNNGRQVKIETFNSYYDTPRISNLEYDTIGQVIKYNNTRYSYLNNGNIDTIHYNKNNYRKFYYDKNYNIMFVLNQYGDTTEKYSYNSKNDLIALHTSSFKYTYIVDSLGNRLQSTVYNNMVPDNKQTEVTTYKYNEKGLMIEQKIIRFKNVKYQKLIYEYNDNGLLSKIIRYKSEDEIDSILLYSYEYYKN
jgi:hypothetical protein